MLRFSEPGRSELLSVTTRFKCETAEQMSPSCWASPGPLASSLPVRENLWKCKEGPSPWGWIAQHKFLCWLYGNDQNDEQSLMRTIRAGVVIQFITLSPETQMVKNLPAMQETQVHSIPGSGRSPGEGNSNPSQYSCLENPMDRGAWKVPVHGYSKSQTQLSD